MSADALNRLPVDRTHLAHFFGVVTDSQSYRNILYLLLAFPLGYLYFMVYVVSVAFGIALSFLVIGIPILFAALVGARYLARFERWQANALLETDIQGPARIQHDDLWETAVSYVTAQDTWRGLGFIALKFWLGLISFVLVLVGFVTVIALVTAPVGETELFLLEINDSSVFGWSVDSTIESIIAVPAGILLLFVVFHVCNGAATLSGIVATALLDEGAQTPSSNGDLPPRHLNNRTETPHPPRDRRFRDDSQPDRDASPHDEGRERP